jgi:hydrogenase-4 transcriptional activator
MKNSSASGKRIAPRCLEDRSVNGFHQDVESRSTVCLNGAGPDHVHAPARLTRQEAFSRIVYASRAMDEIVKKIERMCDCSEPILITGETGTGKELIARAVHALSPRHKREFIPFNCGEVAPELIASELFGHQRGAFTGADRDCNGVIRAANGGTLLLDEIGELPPEAQPRLLRFLEESEVRPLGAPKPIKTDVRVIAATNRDLEAEVRAGRFRDDLFWRLNVFCVHILPLRKRGEDIRPLINYFLVKRQQETGKQGLQLSEEAWALLLGHHWPGNVREVKNAMYRLVALARNGEVIGRESALDTIRTGNCAPSPAAVAIGGGVVITPDTPLHEATDEVQIYLIEHALRVTGGNKTQAAARLKVHRDGLGKMIDRLKIKVDGDDQRK